MASMDFNLSSSVAAQFAKYFYAKFDENRAELAPLYVDASVLSFEGAPFVGVEAIMKKITGLPFKIIQHAVTTIDGLPTIDNSIIVHVVGQLKTDNDAPHGFSETFYLKKANDTWLILTDVFRLNLHSIAT